MLNLFRHLSLLVILPALGLSGNSFQDLYCTILILRLTFYYTPFYGKSQDRERVGARHAVPFNGCIFPVEPCEIPPAPDLSGMSLIGAPMRSLRWRASEPAGVRCPERAEESSPGQRPGSRSHPPMQTPSLGCCTFRNPQTCPACPRTFGACPACPGFIGELVSGNSFQGTCFKVGISLYINLYSLNPLLYAILLQKSRCTSGASLAPLD